MVIIQETADIHHQYHMHIVAQTTPHINILQQVGTSSFAQRIVPKLLGMLSLLGKYIFPAFYAPALYL
jgi:hypothetical protein